MARYLVILLVLISFIPATSAKEYLPGIEWPEPAVVTPGEPTNRPPSDAIVLFDGTDLSAWTDGAGWRVDDGDLIVGHEDIRTRQAFGDCQVHLEWMIPSSMPGRGQGRGNSGIYFAPHYNRQYDVWNKYEIQILDSYRNKTYFDGQAGAVYKQSPPMVNAMRPNDQWNTYDILWTRPRFNDDGTLKSPAYVTLIHNGVLLHNHFELIGATCWLAPAAYAKHADKLPIGLQNHGNPVRFRNIWVRELTPMVGKRVAEPSYGE